MNPDSFHGSHRGCKTMNKKQPGNTPNKLIEGKYCLIHKVDLCGSCFWEWGHGLSEELRAKKVTKPYGIHTLKNETLSLTEEAL